MANAETGAAFVAKSLRSLSKPSPSSTETGGRNTVTIRIHEAAINAASVVESCNDALAAPAAVGGNAVSPAAQSVKLPARSAA